MSTEVKSPTLVDAVDAVAGIAGVANVIMQLSRPGVGYGVVESKVESGRVFDHPWKRARTTFTYLSVAILGRPDDKAAYREAVNAAHRQVRSDINSPVKYNAFDRDLQMWVAACLYKGFEDTYQLLHGQLTEEESEIFYHSGFTLGTTLQVPQDLWPTTRKDFENYWEREFEQVNIDEVVREYLTKLAELRFLHPLIAKAFGPFHLFITKGFLPENFREAMKFNWTFNDQRKFDRFVRSVAFINRKTPKFIRHLPYQLLLKILRFQIRTGRPLA
ncbi:MAG: oxygenase MpaB family protein [Mycobacteriaceae bacterium]